MKYFKEFNNITEYDNEKNSSSIPNICHIVEDDVVKYSTKSISDAVVSCDDSVYNGERHIATNIVITVNGTTLTNNVDYVISNNNGGINAGNYYFTVTGINNYCGSLIGRYSINKATPVISAPIPKVLIYNGQAQELIVAGSTNYGTLKYSMDDSTWSTSIPKATNSGNYTVWYRVEGNSNVNNVTENSIVCSINKSQSSFTVILSKYTYTYNGSTCEPSVTVKNGDIVIPSTQYSVSYNNNINAGTATVTVMDNDGSIIGSEAFTIEKANGSVSTAPTIITGLTYNAMAHILVNPGVGTGTMLYKVDSSSWGGSIPSATNANTYTVYYKASASTNYNESASGSVTCSIAKVTPTVNAPIADIIVYNGSAQSLANPGSTDYGTIQYCLTSGGTYDVNVPSATNAGDYSIWYKVIGDSNINDVAPASITASILEKYVSSPKIELDPSGYTYNGSACTPTVVVKDGTTVIPSNEYTIEYNNNTNAGNASVNVNDNTRGNYEVNGETTFIISKANGSVSTPPTAKSLTYNGNIQALINAGSSSTGVMVYKIGNGSWTEIIPAASNVGSYTVYYKASESTNYNESASGSVNCSISKANPSYVAPTAKGNLIYDSTEKELLNVGSTNDGLMEYSNNGTTWSTSVPKATNAGTYSTYWRITGDDNHNDKASTIISVTIAKAPGSVTTKPTAKSLTYNASAQTLINAGSGTGTMLYKLGTSSWDTIIPSGTNAGSYTVYYKASATTNYNESASGSVAVTINKVTPTVTAPVPKSLTYNGSAQVLVSGGSTDWGVLKYSLDNKSYSTSIPSGTNAGDYSVYYKVDGDNNINGVAAQSVSVLVNKAAGSVTTSPTAKSLTYNGSSQALVNAGVGTGTMLYKEGENPWSTNIPSGTNASSYTVYYKASASTNYNESTTDSVSVTINKVTPTVTAPTAKSLTYNGSAQVLANAGSTNWGTLKYSSDGSTYGSTIPSGTNAGDYSVYYRVDGDSNINDVAPQSLSVSIAKAAGSVTTNPTAKSLTYNGSAQALVNAGSGTGTMLYKVGSDSWGTTIPSGTNAGSYTVYYKASASTNYNESASGSVSCSIAKVTPTVTAPTAKSLTYNGSAQALVNAGSTNYGVLKYSLDGSTYSTDIPSGTNANTYTVYYRVDGDSNINDVAAQSLSVSITKAAGSVTTAPTAKLLTYNATSQALVNAGSGTGTMLYKMDNDPWDTSISTSTNAGSYTVYYKASASTNYNESASGSVACSIAKAAGSVATKPTAKTLTYNGNGQALVNAGSGTGTMLYKMGNDPWDISIPSGTNAWSYTIYYKASASTNYNESASGNVSCSIAKVTPTVTAPTAKSLTYNGSPQVLANAGSTNWGTLQYSKDNNIWSTSMPTEINAGNYMVYYKVDGDSNINSVAAKSISTPISRASRIISFTTAPTSVVVGSSATVLSEVSAGSGDGTITYSSSNSSIASVNGNVVTGNDNGTCSITASVSQGTNYVSASTSYTLTVEGYTYVDLGLPSGTRWAKCDMGSSSQEGVGEYFSWGNISGHTREEGYTFSVENYASTSGYYVSGDIFPASENDAPRNVWGAPWRLPTKDEVDELLANTDKENITISGRNCWKFINRNDSSKYIIFPKVGYYNGTTLNRDNERVFMWSNNNNSVETPDEAYTLFLGSSNCIAQNINRYIGNTIRPVQDNGGNEEFVFFSDPHVFIEYSEVKWDRDIHLDVMQKYFNLTSSNFIICGGDWLWAHTLQVAIDDLEMANQRMVNMFGDKYYPVLGNHDLNDEGDAEIPASTLTNILFSRWNKHYYTFNGRNTIFYVFDTGSSLNTAMNSYRYEQVKWFCNGLVNNTNSHIVIVMHMAQTGTEDDAPITCPMAQNLSAAANAFNNRSSYTVDGSSYNFSSCVGRVHIILAGHWHQDNNYVYNNIPIYIIDDARTGNFDIISLDYTENKLKSKRIGTGNDRVINLA